MDIAFGFPPIAEESESAAVSEMDLAGDAAVQNQNLIFVEAEVEVHNSSGGNNEIQRISFRSHADAYSHSQMASSTNQNGIDGDTSTIAVRESPPNESHVNAVGLLRLSHMNLSSIPSFPIDSSSLTRIDMSYNKLKEIPPFFLQNKFKNVTIFDISFNRLKNIPEEFSSSFPSLTCLDISSNEIQKLPLSLRNCRLMRLKCVDNPLYSVLQGILGGKLNSFSDLINPAVNLRYFFGIISFYLSLEKPSFEQKEKSLRKWSKDGNYKATLFLKLIEVYRNMDQANEDEKNDTDEGVRIKVKRAHQRFSQIAPLEVSKFKLEASMESLESLLHSIGEIQPEDIVPTQVVKEYLDVVNEKIEKKFVQGLKQTQELEPEIEVVDETMPVMKPPVWTKKERRWFLSGVSIVGFIGCYFIFWPLMAALLLSPDGLEHFRRNYLSWIIPYKWTFLLASIHSLYQGWILKFLPVFISTHLPLIDYHFPFWQKIWNWISSFL